MIENATLQAMKLVEEEIERRSLRVTQIEVIDYQPQRDDPDNELAPSGSITLYIGERGSKAIQELKSAITSDRSKCSKIVSRFLEQSAKREEVTLEEAAKIVTKQPVIGEIRYGSRCLASSLFVPKDVELCAVALAYNGGKLLPFDLVEFYDDQNLKAYELQAIALRRAPKLSKAEIAALQAVPSSQLERNVSSAQACYALSAVAVAVLVTLAAICSYSFHSPFVNDEDPRMALSEDELERIGPEATARKLLALRRKALEVRRLSNLA